MWTAIKLYMSKIWDFIYPMVLVFLKTEAPIIAAAALKAVATVEQMSQGQLNGSKANTAFGLIVKDLKTQSITISTQMINEMIEAAVRKLFPNDEN